MEDARGKGGDVIVAADGLGEGTLIGGDGRGGGRGRNDDVGGGSRLEVSVGRERGEPDIVDVVKVGGLGAIGAEEGRTEGEEDADGCKLRGIAR